MKYHTNGGQNFEGDRYGSKNVEGSKSLACLIPRKKEKAPEKKPISTEEPWVSLKGMGPIQRYIHSLGHCLPWFNEALMDHCKRDLVELAGMFMRPPNRCGPKGECPVRRLNEGYRYGDVYGSCVIYNDKKFYPEKSPAGVCITANGGHSLSYVEFCVLA